MIKKITKFVHILVVNSYVHALLSHRVAAGVEHSPLLVHLNSQDLKTVVDVGANRGQFALVAREHFPTAKVFSFEPLNEAATVFRRLFALDPQVILHEIAIGPDNKDMMIHVSRADDSSSLLPIASLQNKLFSGTDEKEQRKISVRRLDSILCREDIDQPALLKIDVQGFEKNVFEGCSLLLPCFSRIYVECSFMELYEGQALAHEIISFLKERDFVLAGTYNLSYDKKGVAIQGDFLFERKDRPV